MKGYIALLGLRVTDKVTGFAGVVESISFDLYGCVQCYARAATGADGKQCPGAWFDHKRLNITDKTPVMEQPNFDNGPGSEHGPADKGQR